MREQYDQSRKKVSRNCLLLGRWRWFSVSLSTSR